MSEELPIVRTFSELLNPEILVENAYLFATLSIFLGMYGPRLHPKLPDSVKVLFENLIFRCSVLFLVAYMAHRDFTGALIISIVFVVTMNLLHTTEVLKNVSNILTSEKFSNGPPVANCNTYVNSNEKNLGTKFYPLHASEDSSQQGNIRLDH